ncbi:MAG: glycosyltransferase [Sulfurimicrobium sp.]|nr:glycosyltransferase [Sulfurimicrobium sp.]
MKVLQVNVRLQEGGAARIALDLHRQLLNSGVESRFAYGWGEKGGRSSAEASVPHSFQVGQQIQVTSNMLLHAVAGIDCVPPVGAGRKSLIEAIHWSDVVHLHAIHSYFLPFGWLVKELVRAGKPVIWTAHDYWMLTGRCASPEGCEGWRKGCGFCPTQKNYPPAYLDFSATQFKVKRKLLAELGSRLHVVAPSEFVAQAIREGLTGVEVYVIPNWIDSEFVAALQDIPLSTAPINLTAEKIMVIIIANDLSDPTKVDRTLVNQLLEMPHIEIHTVGLNSPFTEGRVVNYGRIANRKLMVEAIASADVALFTSEKDTFGLVMIEALACGVPVIAVDSLASREVLMAVGVRPVKNKQEIVELLQNFSIPNSYANSTRASLREKVFENYCGGVAFARYIEFYAFGKKPNAPL